MENGNRGNFDTSIPIFAFSGYSNSGKTTLLCKVVRQLTNLGIRVATIKHDGHDFSMDQEKKDTWLHHEAGSEVVVIASKHKIAMIDYREYDELDQLREAVSHIHNVDIILVEGFKHVSIPRIFVTRNIEQMQFLQEIPLVEGIATDFYLEHDTLQVYDIEDIQAMSQYIVQRFQLSDRANER